MTKREVEYAEKVASLPDSFDEKNKKHKKYQKRC